jgi:AraC-like DNA-binding protein
MARNSKTVSSAVVRLIQRRLQAHGMSPEDFVTNTGVTALEIADPKARVGRERYVRVLRLIASFLPTVASSVRMLEDLSKEMPLLVGSWLNAPTMRAALDAFVSLQPLLNESDRLVMFERDGFVRMEFHTDDPQELAAFQAKSNFNLLVDVVRNYDHGASTRFSAELTTPHGSTDRDFEAMLGGRCAPDRAVNALQFEAKNLDARFPRYNPALAQVLASQVAAELAGLERDSSLSLTVERSMRTVLAGDGFTSDPGRLLARLCAEVGMSRWTLQRKLAAEGASFQALWKVVRVQEARRLLVETSLSVGEISDRLAFNSQSSFNRFFGRETGVPPLRFRRSGPRAPVHHATELHLEAR